MALPARDALARAWTLVGRDGRPAFAAEQLRHAALFVLVAGAEGVAGLALPEPVAAYVGALGAKLGLRPGAPADAVADALADHFRRHPVHPALLEAARQASVDDAGVARWGVAARAVLQLLDEPPLATLFDAPPRVTGGPLVQAALTPPRAKRRARKPRSGA